MIYEVTTDTLGSLLLDQLPKSKPFTPMFSCKPAARGVPATYDLTMANTSGPIEIPRGDPRPLMTPVDARAHGGGDSQGA